MNFVSGFSATYRHGVPWGVLRVEGVGASGDVPEMDFSEALVAFNEGCLTLAVAPAEIEVEITVASEGPPIGQDVIFVGRLVTPEAVIEVGDLTGEDFLYRFRVSSDVAEVVVSVDVAEDATRVGITVPGVLGVLP